MINEPTFGPHERRRGARTLESFAFSAQGELVRLAPIAFERGGYWGQLYARGARAFLSQEGTLSVVDAREGRDRTLTQHELQGWRCDTLEVHGDRAYCTLGEFGVVSVHLWSPRSLRLHTDASERVA